MFAHYAGKQPLLQAPQNMSIFLPLLSSVFVIPMSSSSIEKFLIDLICKFACKPLPRVPEKMQGSSKCLFEPPYKASS